LVLLGLQNDLFPGGALGFPGGDDMLPLVNRLTEEFSRAALPIVATRDLHPVNHCSFTDQGGSWPPHCIANTPGAHFHPDLQLPSNATIITMGTELDGDASSAFYETDLAGQLRAMDVAKIVLCGLATDYSVKATALDGRREGFEVTVVQDAIRGIDEHPEDSVEALREMEYAGVGIATAGALISSSMM
jgi:nicotinamidase/pyrazinamidase